jgi:cation transport ATPase
MSFLEKIGGFLGGGFGEKMGGVIDQLVRDKDLADRLKHEFSTLIAQQEHALRMAAVDSEKEADRQQQETIRAELAQSDEYTKRTRPMLARRSWWAVLAYVGAGVISAGVTAIPDVPTDWAILTVLASPVLTYMGVRTFDKWKLGK